MGITEFFGLLATIASLIIVAIGLPAQILKNYQRKSCEGLAPSLIYVSCLTYTLWTIYAWLKPDTFLKIAQTPGCILALILLFQLFYFRRK